MLRSRVTVQITQTIALSHTRMQGGFYRQFTVGFDGETVGFEKSLPRANSLFGVLICHPKTRFPYTINSFTKYSNKNTISPISGGFIFNVFRRGAARRQKTVGFHVEAVG